MTFWDYFLPILGTIGVLSMTYDYITKGEREILVLLFMMALPWMLFGPSWTLGETWDFLRDLL